MLNYLIAVGMSLVISGMGTLNFGQGAFFTLASLMSYTLVTALGLPFYLAIVVGVILPFLLGAIVEFLLRPVFGKRVIYSLLITLGICYVMSDIMLYLWGYQVKTTPSPKAFQGIVRLGAAIIPKYYIFVIVLAVIIAVGFWVLFNKTKIGIYFRAIIDDRNMVENLGINVQSMYTLMFMISTGLSGLAGALNAPLTGSNPGQALYIFNTVMPILIVGGLSSMNGALPAALVLGLVSSLGALFLPKYYNVLPFAFMVVVMYFKPRGLFAKKEK